MMASQVFIWQLLERTSMIQILIDYIKGLTIVDYFFFIEVLIVFLLVRAAHKSIPKEDRIFWPKGKPEKDPNRGIF